MSKIDVEDMTLARWIILVGRDGISLLVKGRNDRFDVMVAYRWGPVNNTALIHNLMSRVPLSEICDVVLDDHVTRVSYSDPDVAQSSSSVTEGFGRVAVHFFDILKHRACQLESEKSDLEELVEAFSPFFARIRRFVLRSPTQDFRYIVSVDTAAVIKKPYAWFGSIRTALSAVLINRPIAGWNLKYSDAGQVLGASQQPAVPLPSAIVPLVPKDIAAANSSAAPMEPAPLPRNVAAPAPAGATVARGGPTAVVPAPLPSVVVPPAPKDMAVASSRATPMEPAPAPLTPAPPTPAPQTVVPPAPKDMVGGNSGPAQIEAADSRPAAGADPSAASRGSKGKLTFIFSANDDPVIALMAAGVVWSLPTENGQSGPITVTEIGVYRKKLSSPFRRLIGVTGHQETETLPMPTVRLERLIQDFAAYANQPGDHVLFFGYEILSTELLIHISRFLQEAAVRYQIIVCNDSVARSPQLMGFETVFDGLARKSWIYHEGADARRAHLRTHLPHWKTFKTPRLDDVVLKKILEGEFRVVEKLRASRSNLSPSQASAYAHWLAEFGACIAKS